MWWLDHYILWLRGPRVTDLDRSTPRCEKRVLSVGLGKREKNMAIAPQRLVLASAGFLQRRIVIRMTKSCGIVAIRASRISATVRSPSSSSTLRLPANWSFNATNILAQKYFRGTLNTSERETSLKQVVDRIVDTIADWGVDGVYFVDEEETETFRAELKHLLITQRPPSTRQCGSTSG